MNKLSLYCVSLVLLATAATVANAQSFQVQCPTTTITHPANLHDNNSEPTYIGPTTFQAGTKGYIEPTGNVNGAITSRSAIAPGASNGATLVALDGKTT